MSQNEFIRPTDLDINKSLAKKLASDNIMSFLDIDEIEMLKNEFIKLVTKNSSGATFGEAGLNEEQTIIRDQFFKFSKDFFKISFPISEEAFFPFKVIPGSFDIAILGSGNFSLTINPSGVNEVFLNESLVLSFAYSGYFFLKALSFFKYSVAAFLLNSGGVFGSV